MERTQIINIRIDRIGHNKKRAIESLKLTFQNKEHTETNKLVSKNQFWYLTTIENMNVIKLFMNNHC